jgi:hypothetical protein
MSRRVLVGAADHLRHWRAKPAPICEFLDEWGVVGSEIAEQILDADFSQPFEKQIGGGAGLCFGAGIHAGHSFGFRSDWSGCSRAPTPRC